jgi:hypothetical protein
MVVRTCFINSVTVSPRMTAPVLQENIFTYNMLITQIVLVQSDTYFDATVIFLSFRINIFHLNLLYKDRKDRKHVFFSERSFGGNI